MDFRKTNSKWIWNNERGVNQYLAFRKEFDIQGKKASLYVSCDTNYCLWINGRYVEFGQYLAHPNNKHYDLIDISSYLLKGKNLISILVYYQGVSSFSYSVGRPGLFYAIKTENGFISNENTYVKKATGFIDGNVELITRMLGPSFSFDARKDENWISTDYKMDSSWVKAEVCEENACFPYTMKKRPIKKLMLEKVQGKVNTCGEFYYQNDAECLAEKMQNAFLRSDVAVLREENGSIIVTKDKSFVIFDLGAETAGYFYIDFTAPEGANLDISYGEHLCDMRVRAFDADGNKFAFSYISKEGKQCFANLFRRLGGRYIQINFSNLKSPVVIHSVGMYHASYPVEETKKLKLSDTLDKKIYETSVKTLRECMHDAYEDCPWREQGLYAFDSRNQALFGYSVFENGNFEFTKASLRLLADSLGEDGILSICAVTDEKKFKIPSFTLHFVVFVAEYLYYSKDKAFAKEILATIKKITKKYFEEYDGSPIKRKKGECYWNFYDWKGILAGEHFGERFTAQTDSLCNLLAAFALKNAISIAAFAEDIEYKNELENLSRNLCETVNKYFYDEKTGLYKTLLDGEHSSQYAQALALLTGIALNPKACEEALINPPQNMELMAIASSQLKYEALLKNKKNYSFVLSEIRRIWGNMLYDGATTFYETEEGVKDVLAGSLCHGWSAVPIYVYEKIFGNFYK